MYNKTAFYARISKAGQRSNSISNSIKNQTGILYNAVSVLNPSNNGGISEKNSSIQIFIDDGYSGRSTRRPAFRKMLAKAVLGEIDTILVKDFSRFSREHILMSEFLEQVFPGKGIRFISVADCYDSAINNTSLSTSFKSLFNEYYCKDISHKVKSVLSAKKEAGSYCMANVPFGYNKDSCKDGIIDINCCEARIVHKIFTLAAGGLNCREIADILNKGNFFAGRKYSQWDSSYIWSIINNPFYIGMHVWHKYDSGIRLPKECWKTDTGKHSAIVNTELYNRARQGTAKSSPKGRRHIFHGITKCKTCHKALCAGRRKKDFLCCNHCQAGELKKIQTDTLFKICLDRINSELLKHPCSFKDKNILAKILAGNGQCGFSDKELLLHNFIQKIEIGNSHDIDIFWKFHL
ncbi:MAG: recombinase family protein [Lachnospiraceae bacterium]|nr:recombinase family protein [Lachnospiraceae bacterium]